MVSSLVVCGDETEDEQSKYCFALFWFLWYTVGITNIAEEKMHLCTCACLHTERQAHKLQDNKILYVKSTHTPRWGVYDITCYHGKYEMNYVNFVMNTIALKIT